MTIDICNKTSGKPEVSWFCCNETDAPCNGISLASGNLKGGYKNSYDPPKNSNGLYYVRFTPLGGGKEIAGGIVNADQAIWLQYQFTIGRYVATVKSK